ncbi:MAG: family 10 glycosylhydrolase [Lachnospiraceae bacterium]|nr:family 10 glycosylhydrolase [Lachnospiraceae bacterium]
MKRLFMILAVILIAGTLGMGEGTKAQAGSYSVRGVWVSCFEYKSAGLCTKSESQFRANADKLFYNIKVNGCNTVYFHVRSFDDAIYPSATYKWSKYLLDKGAAPTFDPLKILISYAHKYGLSFHAWMNPYRVTYKKVLDPAQAATTERVVNQVKEIINRYPVDGIHFDDYFYPTNEKKYNKVKKATRMANVNAMVRKVYQTVKAKNRKLKFGISPAGNVDNCERIGADVKTWMSQSGYIDYIIPQIYWSDNYLVGGKKTAMFSNRLAQWRSLNTRDIPMYIGLALYRAGEKMKDDVGWKKSSKNIAMQLGKIKAGNSEGYVLFSYTDLYRSGAAKEMENYLKVIRFVKLNKKKKTIRAGKKFKLKLSVSPLRGKKTIKWKSSNKKLATVNKNGVVKAKKKGTVKIYAYHGTVKKYCVVKIKAKKKVKKKAKKNKKK